MEIRRATIADGPAFVTLLADVAAEGTWIATEVPFDHDERRRSWEQSLREGSITQWFAIDAGERLIGDLTLFAGHAEGERILGMLVAQGFRGTGVGTSLMAAALAWADAANVRAVTLAVFPHNERAIALYRRFGFVETERARAAIERRNGERWDAVRMRRIKPR